MSPRTEYEIVLSEKAILHARLDTERGETVRYAVALVTVEGSEPRTVRVYDNAHGRPEMHRYTRAGEKRPAEAAPGNTASEGFNIALELISNGFTEMIDGWQRS